MSLLNRAAIDAANDLASADVPVPEWNGVVRLRMMTADDQLALMSTKDAGEPADESPFIYRLVAMCAVDEQGNRLWPTADDVKALGRKNLKAVHRLFEAAMKLNGMGRFAEDAEKN